MRGRGGAWDDPYWADRITPRETPETLDRLREALEPDDGE